MSSKSWYVHHREKTVGPVSSVQLKKLASEKRIGPETKVRLGETGSWVPAAKVQGLFHAEVAALVPSAPATVQTLAPTKAPVPLAAEPQRIACPMCGELIAPSAVKCRFCNEYLDGRPAAPVAAPAPTIVNVTQTNQTTMAPVQRWSRGTAMLFSFLIPGLGQVYKGQPINGLVWFMLAVIGYVMFIFPGVVVHVCSVLGAATGDPTR